MTILIHTSSFSSLWEFQDNNVCSCIALKMLDFSITYMYSMISPLSTLALVLKARSHLFLLVYAGSLWFSFYLHNCTTSYRNCIALSGCQQSKSKVNGALLCFCMLHPCFTKWLKLWGAALLINSKLLTKVR